MPGGGFPVLNPLLPNAIRWFDKLPAPAMSFADMPKRIDPVVPTTNELQRLPEKTKGELLSLTSAPPVSGGPKSECQGNA